MSTDTVTQKEFNEVLNHLKDLEDGAYMSAREQNPSSKNALPIEMAERIFEGESPVKIWREYRDMTQDQLGEKAGVGKAFLSQVESGKKNPSMKVLKQLAAGLDVDLDDLT
jgi:DNA-binding XRE family transcriptional regulator